MDMYLPLEGKKLLLAVTGSVAAYRMVDFARELIRLGASVQVMLSPEAIKLIAPATFHWATGSPVITEITGDLQHVRLAGESLDRVDLMIVAPATANTLGKISSGIADTNVTLTAMVAIGNKIPLLLVPGM